MIGREEGRKVGIKERRKEGTNKEEGKRKKICAFSCFFFPKYLWIGWIQLRRF